MERQHETLGENVVPSRYTLLFEPDLSTFQFEGSARISVQVKKKTRSITLNAKELKIHEASVKGKGAAQSAKFSLDAKKERLTLTLPNAISGAAEIMLRFAGTHNDQLYGFYRSKYMEKDKERYILTTQFEAPSARAAFPCFDEPAMKAVYDVSMLIPAELQALSNMPVKREEKRGAMKLVTFFTTPKMSTYLLYLGVGDFDVVSDKLGALKVNVITVRGKKKYATLALDYGKRFIRFFEHYFGVKYPLPKLDLIAVPDFAAGAMENWGAITFRETALLADENVSVAAKQRIAETVSHELAHQWFGDLVTMKWWNDLWLNESFATMMAHKAMDGVFPEWNMRVQYLEDVVDAAFAADQLVATHPISVHVNSPADIDEIFDEISYEKGGSVLHMIEDYVGKEVFRKGLNIYLRSHAYGNATKEDLWNALDKAAGKQGSRRKASAVVKDWIERPGYPYVKVAQHHGKLSLTQHRFTLLGKKESDAPWPVPIHYSTTSRNKPNGYVLLNSRSMSTVSREPVIKLNAGQAGLYRTLYSEEKLDELGELIKGAEMEWVDAWGIENDLYAFAKACKYNLDTYLRFVSTYCFAAKYPLNSSALLHLNGLYNLLYNTKGEKREAARKLLREYSNDILKQVGWIRSRDETNTTTMIRSLAIVCSGISGDQATVNKANKLFTRFIEENHEIEPNLKGAVYTLAAWSGNSKTFKTFVDRYRVEQVPEEKQRLLRSLAMFSDKTMLKRALEFSLSKEVRYQDAFILPAIAASKPAGRELIWPWTRRNWKTLMARYPSNTHMLGGYIDNLAVVSGQRRLREINAFFSKRSNMRDDLRMALKQTQEIIAINTRFMKSNKVG